MVDGIGCKEKKSLKSSAVLAKVNTPFIIKHAKFVIQSLGAPMTSS